MRKRKGIKPKGDRPKPKPTEADAEAIRQAWNDSEPEGAPGDSPEPVRPLHHRTRKKMLTELHRLLAQLAIPPSSAVADAIAEEMTDPTMRAAGCKRCRASGKIASRWSGGAASIGNTKPCDRCNGSGIIIVDLDPPAPPPDPKPAPLPEPDPEPSWTVTDDAERKARADRLTTKPKRSRRKPKASDEPPWSEYEKQLEAEGDSVPW